MTFQPTTSVCTYTDSLGSIPGELVNNGTLLLVRLGDIVLLGNDFGGLQPKHPDSLPDRFTLQHGFICNCLLDVTLPIHLRERETVLPADLRVSLVLGKPDHRNAIDEEYYTASLDFRGQRIHTTDRANDFEDLLIQLTKQLPDDVYFFNCFGCQFADYSVYGNGAFGTMMCFRNVKERYNAVNSKLDYRQIQDTFEEIVQEVYRCEEFQRRRPDAGYRG
jgi:hypothetical protein